MCSFYYNELMLILMFNMVNFKDIIRVLMFLVLNDFKIGLFNILNIY